MLVESNADKCDEVRALCATSESPSRRPIGSQPLLTNRRRHHQHQQQQQRRRGLVVVAVLVTALPSGARNFFVDFIF